MQIYGNTPLMRPILHRDETLQKLESKLDRPEGYTPRGLYLHPVWDFLHDDERFNELVRPKNLKEAG